MQQQTEGGTTGNRLLILMQKLELKIPPPLLMLLVGTGMWGISLATAQIEVNVYVRSVAALVIAMLGGFCSFAGVISFRRAKTTINPMKPMEATTLVCSGIYKVTRNPMYTGLLFVLIAWAVYLSSVWALLGPIVFMAYIRQFQIAPEEKVLAEIFGNTYATYRASVRRWL